MKHERRYHMAINESIEQPEDRSREGITGPKTDSIATTIKAKGLTLDNYLWHLDEMTDEEITYMLDQEPGKEQLDEERKAQPNISDRTRAEFYRDF